MPLSVRVSSDKMEVRLVVSPPCESDPPIERDTIDAFLTESKIVNGLDESAIAMLVERVSGGGNPSEDVVVARGTRPIPGSNAHVELHFEQMPQPGALNANNGSIDYYERGFPLVVSKGTLLATKIPPNTGEPGRDVYGKEVPAKPGKDLMLVAGPGAELSADGLECRAGCAGVATAMGPTKVGVLEKYTIPGDVDFHTGNLHMEGALVIQGWVRTGFKVEASGDILIKGGVEPSNVTAGANVVVRGGVFGGGDSAVTVRGGLLAHFLENAQVTSAGDVTVETGTVRSVVSSDGKFCAVRGKGCVVGGWVCAAKGLEVNELGSRAGVRTVVEVGIDRETRAKLARMERDVALYDRNQQKISKGLSVANLRMKCGQVGPRAERALTKLVRIRKETEALRTAIANCRKELEKVDVSVKVKRCTYEGVTVFVSGRRMDVRDDILDGGEFVLDREEGRVTFRR